MPASSIEQIKDRLDIVDIIGEKVNLKKTGRSYKGLCPFHQEKTPSFVVYPENQSYHCFTVGSVVDSAVSPRSAAAFWRSEKRCATVFTMSCCVETSWCAVA